MIPRYDHREALKWATDIALSNHDVTIGILGDREPTWDALAVLTARLRMFDDITVVSSYNLLHVLTDQGHMIRGYQSVQRLRGHHLDALWITESFEAWTDEDLHPAQYEVRPRDKQIDTLIIRSAAE